MTYLPQFIRAAALVLCSSAALTFLAHAEPATWEPQRNVEFIVPTEAGSTMDVLAPAARWPGPM
jgi:tripartite-type tricarboxylate transporter receptor subunit TctC